MKFQRYYCLGLVALSSALLLLSSDVSASTDDENTGDATPPCLSDYLGDGDCDPRNNKEECGYDGGDCCECTCVSSANYTCGTDHHGGYACLDPSAPCVDDDDITILPEYDYTDALTSTTSTCFDAVLADGDCDPINNNEDCGYDGGDCCSCTCVDTVHYPCGSEHHGGFACLDPGAPCVDDDDVTTLPHAEYTYYSGTPSSLCFASGISDGDCDPSNNNEDCDYDGGDCCQCTCVDTVDYACGDTNHGGYACIDPCAECVDDDDITSVPEYRYIPHSERTTTSSTCFEAVMSDGDCDPNNNNAECGYDGGDCCICTCVSTEDYTCGDEFHGGYACLDPSAPCVDDDDVTTLPEFEYVTYSGLSSSACFDAVISDGDCDPVNNNEACGYDGGDCCECTCVSGAQYECGNDLHGGYTCVDPTATCFDGLVEASTKTTVSVSANAYDTRPGQANGSVGCGEDGCLPALSRDGISADTESRWSCAPKIVPGGGPCEIEFRFEDVQDIKNVQVAFLKGELRSRTLEATINGTVIGKFDSIPGSTFSELGIEGTGVQTLKLAAVDVADNGWIGLIEVRFMVEP